MFAIGLGKNTYDSLRLRDPARFNETWTMVRRTLNTTDYYVEWADVFPGGYEAEFSWIASNILRKSMVSYISIGKNGSIKPRFHVIFLSCKVK